MKQQPDNKLRPKRLVQGIDYIVENGLYVFTAKYLLERGFCCENGCRNCPYGFQKKSKAN